MLNLKTITSFTLTALLSCVSFIDSAKAQFIGIWTGNADNIDELTLTLIEGDEFTGTAIFEVQGVNDQDNNSFIATDTNSFDVRLISTSQSNLNLLEIDLGTFEYDIDNDGEIETLDYEVSLRLPGLNSSELSQLSQNSPDNRISQNTFFKLIEKDFNDFNSSSGSSETRFCLPFENEDGDVFDNIPRLCNHTSSGETTDAEIDLNEAFLEILGLDSSDNPLGARTGENGTDDNGAGLRLVQVISTPEPSSNFGMLILGIIGSGLLLNKRIKQK